MKFATACALGLTLSVAPPGDPIEVDFAVLSGFDYVEGMELPAEVTQYDEKTVVLTGFMRREGIPAARPAGLREDVEYFMLVNDACGCEGTPKLNEVVFCAMPEGETTELLPGLAKVTGILYVGEETEDDVVIALYMMDVDQVEENVAAGDRE